MLNSVIEIYRLDINAAYQHAFVYIRQLAVHLRNAITIKKKDGFLQVYNWQFLYALKVWAKLLADTLENNEDGPLKPLVYPLVQVTLGAIKLIPTARYFPLRFHCLKLLLSLVQKTGVYIPLTGYILETLSFAEMKRKPKPQTGPPLDFQGMLKVPKSKINSALFQDAVVAQVFELSIEFYAAIACTVGFPEITFLDTRRLRAFLKLSKSKSVFAKMKPLLEKLEENGKYVTAQRANVGFSPREKEEIGKWSDALTTKGASPLIRYHKVWKSTEVNRKAMMAAVQDVTGDDYAKQKGKLVPSKKKRKGQPASDDDDDDSDSEAEEDESKKPTKKQKKGKAAAAAEDDEESDLGESDAEISDGGNSDDSDELGDFAMSDFEDDDA
jgi:nucleolar complex protein 2